VNFAERYAEICNSYRAYDSGMSVTKKQVETIFSALNIKFTYESKEKSFYRDYTFGSYNARLAITYKYGFIECFYTFWSSENEDRVRGRFNSIALMQDEDFRSKVAHSFPIATSLEDLESILTGLIQLNNEVIGAFEKNITNL